MIDLFGKQIKTLVKSVLLWIIKCLSTKKDIPQKPHPNCKCRINKVHYVTDYHEILKQAAIYVYHGKDADIPEGYSLVCRSCSTFSLSTTII